MMVMTAKVDSKKILLLIAALAALVLSLILVLGGGEDTAATGAPMVSDNDQRVQFLKSFGWEVVNTPTQTGQVRIPRESSQVFDRYNALQKSQGYDLTACAGKNVMRYVYSVTNYPGSTEPVYATLLVYKNQIIGGDITDTAAKGRIRGFRMDRGSDPAQPTQETLPETTGAPQAVA